MVKVIPFKILLICFCFISISSFSTQQRPEAHSSATLIQSSHPSLGFANYTSPNATSAQVASFISYINSASIYFRDDAKSRLDYISNQMNKTYNFSDYGFSVIQQGDGNYFEWAFYTYTSMYASVAAGVDKRFTNISYMFIQEAFRDTTQRVFFDKVGQKGSGVDSTLETVIKNVILDAEEDEDICYCYGNTMAIRDELHDFDGGFWNIICSVDDSLFKMNTYVHRQKYIYVKPKNCYYGIYAIQ